MSECMASWPHHDLTAADLTERHVGMDAIFPDASIGTWVIQSVYPERAGFVVHAWCRNLGKRPGRRNSGAFMVPPTWPVETRCPDPYCRVCRPAPKAVS